MYEEQLNDPGAVLMVAASVAGAGMPLLLRGLHMDPAVSAAVFFTAFTGVIGFALFLELAAIFIEFLL
jgi:magnesium transporter